MAQRTVDGGMATPAKRPVAGYIRVSRIGGRSGEGYISPDEQKVQIERYAEELGLTVPPDAWVDDQDRSGGNFDRPGWESIIERIESGELGGVIVMKVDRFARNVPDGATQIRHIVNDCQAFFGSAQERMDPTTYNGLYMLQQFLNNAELQLNMLKASWTVAKERAIARGAHIGVTPLGYGRIPRGEERSGCLFPLAEWRPIVAALFRRAADTNTGSKIIANYMNENYPRPDGKKWTTGNVEYMIQNRVYLGEVRYGSKTGLFAPLVNSKAHEPMIDEATWLAAQFNPTKRAKGTNSHVGNLLAGLVRCAGCRYRMPASYSRGTRVYKCARYHAPGTCPAPSQVNADPLEEFVLGEVRDQWEAEYSVTLGEPVTAGAAEEVATRLAEARGELDAFATDLTARRMLGDGYHAALEARVSAVAAIESEWTALEKKREQAKPAAVSWDSLEPDELRDVIGGALDGLYIRRGRNLAVEDRTWLVWTGQLDDDAPVKGRSNVLRSFEWPEDDRSAVRVAAA